MRAAAGRPTTHALHRGPGLNGQMEDCGRLTQWGSGVPLRWETQWSLEATLRCMKWAVRGSRRNERRRGLTL